jgi:pyruvate dehydrogenase E2 component (dihydrolipoamide acetyltransferase)
VAAADSMRRAIAAAMSRSKREIPHYYLSTEIDVSAPLRRLEVHNREVPPAQRVLAVAVLVRAVAVALAEFPELHGHYLEERFHPGPVHLGFAVALRDGGLVAPAIRDADRLPVGELMSAIADVTRRARSGHLRVSEMTEATVTVTSLGERGVDAVFGVIHPPQVAILGLGRVQDRVVAVGGMVGVRPCLTATLSGDHRVSDGHRGGLFLARVAELLSREEIP